MGIKLDYVRGVVDVLRMTSDEAPRRRGGGMKYAPLTSPRRRLLLPVLALGGLSLLLACATNGARKHFDSGNSLLKQRKLSAAEKEFREAVRLKPDFAEAHFGLGFAIDEQVEYKHLAEREYREAIRLKPNYPEAHYMLGCLLRAEFKNEGAIQELREAVRRDPDWARAHYDLGVLLSLKGDTDEVIKEYREAVRLKPDFLDALVKLAEALDAKGERKEARAYWKKAEKVAVDSKSTPGFVGWIKKRLAEPR
jgi:Flp pilus assembly protein TadD